MTALRVLIVDDEEPARELLRAFLAKWDEVKIIDEAGDGRTALAMIEQLAPDLVFLDVQMPGMSGFDVIAALGPEQTPLVVFVTAYDQYALRAFEVSACDYLLKPFDADRLASTMRRVFGRGEPSSQSIAAALRTLMAEVKPRVSQELIVKVDGRHVFVRPDEIEWLEAVGKEVRLHRAGGTLMVREPMSSLHARLDPDTFLRVHRSAIVNRAYIRELQPWFKGDYVLVLRSGAKVVSGRTHRDAVRRLLDGAFGR